MKPQKKTEIKKAQHLHRPAAGDKGISPKPVIIGTAVIAALAFIVFSPCLTGSFLGWDDYNYIRDNPLIRDFTMANILHVFNYRTIVVGNYHPLTILSYIMEYQVAGLNPFLSHFDNLLLHLANIALFSWLMWLLTKKTRATLIAAALFAVHPMRIESVVWAAERKDVLYTFFFLLSLVMYVHYLLRSKRNTEYYVMSLCLFALSILSKGQAVVLPLTLFLADYWFNKKLTLQSALNKIPYFVLSLASGILAMVAQRSSLTEQRLSEHSALERMGIAAFNITAYLYKLVWPFDLSCFYKYPARADMAWVWAGALAAVAVIVLAAVFFRKNRVVVFGSLFFLFTISIVTQLLPVGNAIIADRYTYIPYIGLFFIIAMLLDKAMSGKGPNAKYWVILPVALVLVFSVKSFAHSGTWNNNTRLWENALRNDPANGVAYTNLAREYIDAKDYATAIDLLNKAVANEGTFTEVFHAYQNLGVAYSRSGKNQEAVRYFSIALARRPGFVDAIFSRGLAYTSLQKYDSAVADFTTVLSKLDTLNTKSYYSRGIALNKMGEGDRAIADYTSAIRIDPNYGDPYVNRANIYFTRNQFEPALADYDMALKINPDDGNTWMNRSFLYFKMQRYKEALTDALKARDLKQEVNPNYLKDVERMASGK